MIKDPIMKNENPILACNNPKYTQIPQINAMYKLKITEKMKKKLLKMCLDFCVK